VISATSPFSRSLPSRSSAGTQASAEIWRIASRTGSVSSYHPKRGRVRRDRPEQRLLIAHRPQIRHALAAVGEHHRQITNHTARVVTATALLDRAQPQRQRLRQPQLVGHLRQQCAARVRHQPRSVRRDFYGYRASITHHLQGEPPSSIFDS